MYTYKIVVSGRGFDCKVFPLTSDQIAKLAVIKEYFEEALSKETLKIIFEITGHNFNENDIDYFDADKSIFGPNDSDGYYSVCVFDKDDELIFDSPDNWLEKQFEDEDLMENLQDEYWKNDKLLMAQYCKADFFEYQLDLVEPFDPSLLNGSVTLIAEKISLLTDLYYDGNKLQYSEVFQDVNYMEYYAQLMING